MSTREHDPALVKKAADALRAEGADPGNGIHSWRCEDKERYPEPCSCVEDCARAVLDVAANHYWSEGYDAANADDKEAWELLTADRDRLAARLAEVEAAYEAMFRQFEAMRARAEAAERRLAEQQAAIGALARDWARKGDKAAGDYRDGRAEGDASHSHYARTTRNHANALRALLDSSDGGAS